MESDDNPSGLNVTSAEFKRDLDDADNMVNRAGLSPTIDQQILGYVTGAAQFAQLQLKATLDIITLLGMPPHFIDMSAGGVAADGAAMEALISKYRDRAQGNVGEIHVGQELPAGYCGNSKLHAPHVVETSTLGAFACTGDPDDREPGRSERRRLTQAESEEQAANINPQTGEA